VKSNVAEKTSLRRKIQLFPLKFTFAISRKFQRNDFKVAALASGKIAFPKIDQALNLISRFDLRSYCRIQRDVKKILVFTTTPYCAEWIGQLQMCVLDREYLCHPDVLPEEIASTIIHEATHARLERAKINYKEEMRSRIERICVKSEIAFARRLPNGEQLIKKAESRLKIPETFWKNSEFQQRQLDAIAELGEKFWPARLLYPVAKWIVKRRKR
jgi:hypothetical protein